jgi:hypothetical protein
MQIWTTRHAVIRFRVWHATTMNKNLQKTPANVLERKDRKKTGTLCRKIWAVFRIRSVLSPQFSDFFLNNLLSLKTDVNLPTVGTTQKKTYFLLASSKSFKKREETGAGFVIQWYRSEDGSGKPSAKAQKNEKKNLPAVWASAVCPGHLEHPGFLPGSTGTAQPHWQKNICFQYSISVVLSRKILLYSVPDTCTGIRFLVPDTSCRCL